MNDDKTKTHTAFPVRLKANGDNEQSIHYEGQIFLTKEILSPDGIHNLPWQKGMLLEVLKPLLNLKHPVPVGSVVMFLDHSVTKFDIADIQFEFVVAEKNKEESAPLPEGMVERNKNTSERIQHKITVLFDEKLIDVYLEKPLESLKVLPLPIETIE